MFEQPFLPRPDQASAAGTRARGGFTLVELLVVIAIIGILIALLLPAVQAAREAARKIQCNNNLKQLALALHDYHDVHKGFPPSVTFDFGQNPGYSSNFRPNWLVRILPFIEQETVYNLFDFTQYLSVGTRNRQARGTSIPTFLCPTDIGADVPFAGSVDTSTGVDGDNWARGNYGANGANGGLGQWGCTNAAFMVHAGDWVGGVLQQPDQASAWVDLTRRGVMGCNVSVPLGKISDGASHTILLAELRIGVNQYDQRGTWALGTAGASALFWHGYDGDANGPNACQDGADDLRDCVSLHTDPGNASLVSQCMGCANALCYNDQGGSRSRHAGGVFVAFCDGSVHWVDDSIAGPGAIWFTAPGPWDHLITCCDGGTQTLSGLGE